MEKLTQEAFQVVEIQGIQVAFLVVDLAYQVGIQVVVVRMP